MSKKIFVYPKNPKVFELVKLNAKRSLALDKIKGEKGLCKWCLEKTGSNRKKYCSIDCKDSAWAFFYPQKHAYEYLSQRQDGKCAHCLYCFADRTKKRIYSQHLTTGWDKEKNERIQIKEVIHLDDMGEVDHIIPIHKGGEILGIENHQLLCRDCHLIKSGNERRKAA